MRCIRSWVILFQLLWAFLWLRSSEENISIIITGDIMPGTDYPSARYLPADNGEFLISETLKEILQKGDILCGNLEGCILSDGEPSLRKKSKFMFRIPERLTGIFTKSGFDLLSVANNHSGDFGKEGRISTANMLDSLGIGYAGFLEKPAAVITKKGLKIGFIALAPFRGCLSHWQSDEIEAIIDSLSMETDIIIASMHYGGEGEEFLHLTGEDEYYYTENRGDPEETAHFLIDSGVDLIYGHGPHVPRAIEIYKGKLIAYSLGNFLTYGRFDLEGDYRPLAPILRVYYNKKGNFRFGEIISYRQNYSSGIIHDESRKAAQLIKSLTADDFPDSRIRFLEDKRGVWFYGI